MGNDAVMPLGEWLRRQGVRQFKVRQEQVGWFVRLFDHNTILTQRSNLSQRATSHRVPTYTERMSSAQDSQSLRSRRHRQTRSDIVDAAFALFAERGYVDVTMEEIAAKAGVSRSTVYRRFPTKEDVVLDVPMQWLDAFDAAVEVLPDDATLDEAFHHTAMAVATHIDENLERARASYAVLEEAPTLKVSGVATTAWLTRMAALAERYGSNGETDIAADPDRAAIIAGAYLGGIDAMMFQWASGGATEPVAASTARLHRYLRPLLF